VVSRCGAARTLWLAERGRRAATTSGGGSTHAVERHVRETDGELGAWCRLHHLYRPALGSHCGGCTRSRRDAGARCAKPKASGRPITSLTRPCSSHEIEEEEEEEGGRRLSTTKIRVELVVSGRGSGSRGRASDGEREAPLDTSIEETRGRLDLAHTARYTRPHVHARSLVRTTNTRPLEPIELREREGERREV